VLLLDRCCAGHIAVAARCLMTRLLVMLGLFSACQALAGMLDIHMMREVHRCLRGMLCVRKSRDTAQRVPSVR
jgi:hypothetical protein